jgi:hypothetical protein
MSNNTAVKVGDIVRFRFGPTVATGKVIEDRGPLGVEGRQLYRIRYTLDPEFTSEIELTADKFEVVRDQASAG